MGQLTMPDRYWKGNHMATIDSPDIVQNIMDNKGWYIDEGGERDFMQALYVYEYHNVFFHKISFCVCYSQADDTALRTSPAVGAVLMLWSRAGAPHHTWRHPIGTLAVKLRAEGVVL